MQKYFHSKNMANVKITTGQFVSVEQQVSSVIERIYAQMLDYVFISFYFGIVMVAVMLSLRASYNDNIITAIFIVLILPVIFYHPIFEFILNGASPGKKIMKLRVIMKDGSSPTLGAYLMRWMMSLLECMMLPGLGILCILFNKNGQRLGDMMAGTVVVKNNAYMNNYVSLGNLGYIRPDYRPVYPEVASLSLKQIDVISDTLALHNDNRRYYIDLLSKKVMETLNIPPLFSNNNEQFLRTVLEDYRYYSSTIIV